MDKCSLTASDSFTDNDPNISQPLTIEALEPKNPVPELEMDEK
jgi:hypothetical protein